MGERSQLSKGAVRDGRGHITTWKRKGDLDKRQDVLKKVLKKKREYIFNNRLRRTGSIINTLF